MASFFSNNQQAEPVFQRAVNENKYNSARANLVLVIAFTLINIILLVTNSNRYFLFSAYIPYFVMDLGMFLCGKYPAEYYGNEFSGMAFLGNSVFAGFIAVALLCVVIYLLCWIFSKKKAGWLIAALVMFVLDSLAMFLIGGISADSIMDVVFHAWVIWSLASGVIAYNKLKKLPEEEEVVVAAEENPVIEAPENVPVEAEETPAEVEETPAEAEVTATEAE